MGEYVMIDMPAVTIQMKSKLDIVQLYICCTQCR